MDRKNGNGFSFTEFNEKEFENTLDRAIQIYCKNSKEWENLVIRALKSDFSWKKPCTKYLDLYKIAIEDKNR